MPISSLLYEGYLLPGIHICFFEEIRAVFCTNKFRLELWNKFLHYVEWIQPMQFCESIYIGGSFVSIKESPNDIDIVLGIKSFATLIRGSKEIKLAVNRNYIKTKYSIDLLLVSDDLLESDQQDFRVFFQSKPNSDIETGILKIKM